MGVVVLDSGVVIAALDATDAHHAATARAMRAARDRGDSFVLPASAYAEALVRPAMRGATTIAQVDDALDAAGIAIADADRAIARRAAALRAGHPSLRLPDALVIATAVDRDADNLLTTDQRWKGLRQLGLRGRLTVVA